VAPEPPYLGLPCPVLGGQARMTAIATVARSGGKIGRQTRRVARSSNPATHTRLVHFHGGVAQSAERGSHKPGRSVVRGHPPLPRPVGAAWSARLPVKEEVAGSNPVRAAEREPTALASPVRPGGPCRTPIQPWRLRCEQGWRSGSPERGSRDAQRRERRRHGRASAASGGGSASTPCPPRRAHGHPPTPPRRPCRHSRR
jgi:hypothetical protein